MLNLVRTSSRNIQPNLIVIFNFSDKFAYFIVTYCTGYNNCLHKCIKVDTFQVNFHKEMKLITILKDISSMLNINSQ